ncbi:MAG: M48 family metalloprotease [Fretibacterium sp.]|nr:M48 family metalloprotease [Fretibacterium sp.]
MRPFLSRGLCLLLAVAFLAQPVYAAAKNAAKKTEARMAAAPSPAAARDAADRSDPDLEKEREIGRRALAQIEERWPLTSDPAATARLNMILDRLEPHMERRIPYEVRLVSTDVQNAFCLPGGYIFFTTGIMDLLKTDSELAAVMAHEMVHADRKHGLKMAAQSNKTTLAALAVVLLSGGALAPVILAQVAQVAITNAYSIELEAEADSRGLDALIASGYPPTAMVTLMEKFMDEELKQPIREYGIYMNHPDSRKRLQMALEKLHDLGIPVRRKHSLGLLRTGFRETKRRAELTVDGAVVWSGKRAPETRTALERARAVLDEDLQMELAPYDVHLVGGSLYIGNHLVGEPVKGMDSVEVFRQNLLKALDAARRKHPTAKYFQP